MGGSDLGFGFQSYIAGLIIGLQNICGRWSSKKGQRESLSAMRVLIAASLRHPYCGWRHRIQRNEIERKDITYRDDHTLTVASGPCFWLMSSTTLRAFGSITQSQKEQTTRVAGIDPSMAGWLAGGALWFPTLTV